MRKMTIMQGDCVEQMRSLSSDSMDSIVTDPPAGISFMGKDWDSNKGGAKEWVAWMTQVSEEMLRVLKPGGHGLVWAIPRTSHWTATALELAGFEIRDVIIHLFGSGFPKSQNISKAIDKTLGAEREEAKKYDGWGTALKPASEHWILIRKPLGEKTIAKNVLKHGTGGINIDASRVSGEDITTQGRYPANVVLDDEAGALLDEQSGILKTGASKDSYQKRNKDSFFPGLGPQRMPNYEANQGGASRFFYCAKARKKDKGANNTHPTVKNTKLMEYLIKLVTPPGGSVLDPFMGSGSTGVAAMRLGFDFVGVEQRAEYLAIAHSRIKGEL